MDLGSAINTAFDVGSPFINGGGRNGGAGLLNSISGGDATSIKHLLNRSNADKHPLFNFKWVCSKLPFDYDTTYVESLDLPWCNIDQQQGWHGASSFTYYPDFSNVSSFSLTLYEDSSASTLQWLAFWKNQVKVVYPSSGQGGGESGTYFLPKNYKRNMEFKLLATDNSEVLKVTLIGTWPTDTGNLSLDYSQSDRIKVTQTFSCDDQSLAFSKSQVGSQSDSTSNPTQTLSTLLESFTWSNMPQNSLTTVNSFNNSFSFF